MANAHRIVHYRTPSRRSKEVFDLVEEELTLFQRARQASPETWADLHCRMILSGPRSVDLSMKTGSTFPALHHRAGDSVGVH